MVKSPIVIEHNENFNIFDKLLLKAKAKNIRLPLGFVQIFIDNKKVHEGSNLIVAQGREFVAQRIFNINNKSDNTQRPNYKSYTISHFAIGSGGATVSGQDFTLNGPAIGDLSLIQPISLGVSTYLEEPSNYSATGESPLVHTYQDACKPIITDGSMWLEPVSYEGTSDYYTKVLCTCVVPAGEPTMINSSASVMVSEAGLYFSSSSTVKLFSHICFAPKWKEKESELRILWYILC